MTGLRLPRQEITANLTVGYDEFAHPGQLTGEPVQAAGGFSG